MRISPVEKKKLNLLFENIMASSQKSMVSLRKNDFDQLTKNVEGLADSISEFIAQTGGDLLPVQAS